MIQIIRPLVMNCFDKNCENCFYGKKDGKCSSLRYFAVWMFLYLGFTVFMTIPGCLINFEENKFIFIPIYVLFSLDVLYLISVWIELLFRKRTTRKTKCMYEKYKNVFNEKEIEEILKCKKINLKTENMNEQPI